jgi:SAM-dependent methyltransferase
MDPENQECILCFRAASENVKVAVVLPEGYQAEFVTLFALLGAAGGKAAAKALFAAKLRWLFSLRGEPDSRMRMLVVRTRDRIVHFSVVGRIPGRLCCLAKGDLEIGPCQTTPECRGQGLYKYAIRRICHDFAAEGRLFWMMCRATNQSSSRGILGAGFKRYGTAARRRRLWLPLLHTYVIDDKFIERARYDLCGEHRLMGDGRLPATLRTNGADAVEPVLRRPYLDYEAHLRNLSGPGKRVLDLGCGDGVHSVTAAFAGAEVWGLDISEQMLDLARARARATQIQLHTVCGDMEDMPVESGSFDVVCCAGSFAYAKPELLVREVLRVLKPDGSFVLVDVFDCNPIYRLNRFWHYFCGHRAWGVIRRAPDNHTLELLRRHFGSVSVEYYGIFSFVVPLLRLLSNQERVAAILDRLDRTFWFLKRYAFRVVVVARR